MDRVTELDRLAAIKELTERSALKDLSVTTRGWFQPPSRRRRVARHWYAFWRRVLLGERR